MLMKNSTVVRRYRILGTASVMMLGAMFLFSGCAKKADQTAMTDSTSTTIKIIPADASPAFPDAKLVIVSPTEGQVLKSAADSVKVVMNVTGMDLAKATEGDSTRGIAYSKEGQHVHVIIDEKPYMADYKNGQPFNVGILGAGEHTIRAFPSRSWHESVKVPAAFASRTFYVADGPTKGVKDSISDMLKAPLLTYSRPKGSYSMDEAKKLLLDFYVSNAKLGPNDYKVAVAIDTKSIDTLTDWKAYYITGLTAGKHSVSLWLLDSKGMPVPGTDNAPLGEFTIKP